MASPAAIAGQQGRQTRAQARLDWFGDNVATDIRRTMSSRIKLASQLTRDKTVANISLPVTKSKGPRGKTVVTGRSSRGEFPRADTTRLMKDVFWEVVEEPGGIRGRIGTTLDYGLILETSLGRSFLVRTINEQRAILQRMLTAGRPAFPSDGPDS